MTLATAASLAVLAASQTVVAAGAAPAPGAGVEPVQAGQVAAARAKPRFKEYVSLGDSWSADVVLLDSDGVPDATYAQQIRESEPKLVRASRRQPRGLQP